MSHTLSHLTTGTGSRRVFRYVRNLSGIVGQELTPSNAMGSSALNPSATRYLWAHGYQPQSIRLIREMYERATDVDSFVDSFADTNISVAEAQCIFFLIHGI